MNVEAAGIGNRNRKDKRFLCLSSCVLLFIRKFCRACCLGLGLDIRLCGCGSQIWNPKKALRSSTKVATVIVIFKMLQVVVTIVLIMP